MKMKIKQLKLIGVVAFCTAVAVYVCVMAHLNIKHFEKTILTQTKQHLLSVAEAESTHIESAIDDVQNELRYLALNPKIQDAVSSNQPFEDVLSRDGYSPAEVLEHFAGRIDALYQVNADGIVQARIPRKQGAFGSDYSNNPGVKTVLNTQRPYISDLFESNSGRKCFTICQPVFKDQRFVGIIRALTYINAITDKLKLIKTGQEWIIDDKGIILSHPDDNLIGRSILTVKEEKLQGDEEVETKLISSMLSGNPYAGVLVFDELSDEKIVVACVPVKLGNKLWSLAAHMNYDEVSAPIEAHSRILLLDMVCIVCILVAIGLAYYRVEKKRAFLETQSAIGRVNKELQTVAIEREETATSLQQQAELLNNIVSSVPYHIFWKDTDSVYQGCNESFAVLAGVKEPENIIGKTDHDLVWGKDQAKFFVQCDREIVKTGIPLLNMKESLPTADGKAISIKTNKTPLRDSKGNITGVLGVFVELKRAEDTRKEITVERPVIIKQDNKLSADMNYEIRTSVNSIIGFADMLKQEGLTDEQVEFINTISASAQNLLGVINEKSDSPKSDSPKIDSHDRSPEKTVKPIASKQSTRKEKAPKPVKQPQHSVTVEEGTHVLLVDDVSENLMLLEVLLKKAGYKTTSCTDGKQAVELAKDQKFDLILMDIRMPVMDGLEAVKLIKADSLNSTTAVIAMTADDAKNEESLCIEAGYDDFVAKPIKKDALLQKMWRFIQQTKQAEVAKQGNDITSFHNDNPDYHKAIETFVNNLPEQINVMQQALEDGNMEELTFKVHALKGLGGFAGFPIYTERARALEQAIQDDHLDKVRQQLAELAELCNKTKLTNS